MGTVVHCKVLLTCKGLLLSALRSLTCLARRLNRCSSEAQFLVYLCPPRLTGSGLHKQPCSTESPEDSNGSHFLLRAPTATAGLG